MGRYDDPRRFWDRVCIGDACWEWHGGVRNAQGYGGFNWNGKKQMAHRVAWQLWVGPIPEGMSVLHRCDNRLCVRPDHLFLGTHLDNMRDAVAKQRTRRFRITHCLRGHEYTSDNTRWQSGQRVCIACARRRGREYMAGQRARKRAS